MKILVVEDDRAVAKSLQLLLGSYQYAVDIAADGEAALQMADAFEYHLVLLDVLLPRLDGIEVCRQLRKKGFQQPILLLTGQGDTQQKAIALNTGADDYVVKPYDNDELIARIQALLRRGTTAGEPILTWGHLSLDPSTKRVAYQDRLLVLTPKEFAILELFLRHQETVFSAGAILDLAWNSVESPGEESVRCHIKALRRKLTAVGAPKDSIKTAYRMGYRLNPLYASPADRTLNAPQVAELRSVNEELRVALEQLRSLQAELHQKNQELQEARDELEHRIGDRTTELQTLYDRAPCGYHSLDAEGRIVQINETELKMFGYEPEEMIGRKITDFYTKKGQQTVQENYPKFIEQGWLNDLEFAIVRKDGSLLPVRVSGTVIKDEAGNFLKSRSIVVDISDRVRIEDERERAEEALRVSEEKYRSLFESIDEGFCIIERLPGEPIDFRYLEANPAFAVQTGISDVVGKTLRQVLPDVPEAACEISENVLNTGEPLRFEIDVPSINRILELYAFRIDGVPRLAIIFKDITERKCAEAQQAFLLKFSDALRAEPDADAVANRAIRMLFEQMQLDLCYVGVYRLADDRADFTHQVGNDRVPPLPDGIRLSDFPEALRVAFDRTLAIDDIAETEGLSDTDRRSIAALGFRALVAATLRKGENKPLWAIVSVSAHPRHWTRGEIALVEEVTERTWAAMEGARAEEALRNSEAKYRVLFETMDEGYLLSEVIFDENNEPIDILYLEANPAAVRLAGRDFTGQRMREMDPNYEEYWYEIYGRVALTGESVRVERYAEPHDRWFDLFAFKVGGQESRRVAVIFNDITERKQQEQRQAFLLQLSDILRAEPDANSIASRAIRMLAEHLRLDRFWLSEVVEQQGISTVGPEYHRPDLPPMSGVFRLSDYPETIRQLANEPMVIHDVFRVAGVVLP